MIAIDQERLIPLRRVPHHLPVRPNGRRVHISAVYRWIQRGIRGIRLETIAIGGTTYTSVQALQRFADALNLSKPIETHIGKSTPKTRRRQIETAAEQLHALLHIGKT